MNGYTDEAEHYFEKQPGSVTEQLNCEVHMHIGISMPIMTWLPLMHSEETGKRGMRT